MKDFHDRLDEAYDRSVVIKALDKLVDFVDAKFPESGKYDILEIVVLYPILFMYMGWECVMAIRVRTRMFFENRFSLY